MLSTSATMRSVLSLSALLLVAAPAFAGDEAVSDINLKLSGFGGLGNAGASAEGFYGLAGSISMPIEHSIGFQVDAAVAGDPGDYFYDLGAHLFWRDPGTGLLGVYAGMARSVSPEHHQRIDHFGVEAERYLANMTYSAALGYEHGNNISGLYGNLKLDYFLTSNFMTSGGLTYEAGKLFYSSRAEYQLRTDHELGLSFFGSSDWHSSDIYQVMGGVRLTLGEPMTLRDRQRHQDPASYLNADRIGTELSEYSLCGPTQEQACPTAPPPP
jgi:hypothetical protein